MYSNEKELQDVIYNAPDLLAVEPDVKVYSIACIAVDVTESPIQRPQKTKKRIIRGKRSVIP